MQNFSYKALKLREEIEVDEWTYCKNAKFQWHQMEQKFCYLLCSRGIKSSMWNMIYIRNYI